MTRYCSRQIEVSHIFGCLPFTKNFRNFRWKFPSGEKRVPFNSGPFAAQWLRFKNVAENSLEVVRPFKSCKWNTHFHRKVSNGKTGLPFQKFRLFRKFSSGTNQKRVFHLHPNRNFRNFLVNGKRPLSRVLLVFWLNFDPSAFLLLSAIASCIHSYFDNVMSQFMINNRTDAWKTDINLVFYSCLLSDQA